MFKVITSAAIREDDGRAFIIKHCLNKVSDNRAVLLISISIWICIYKEHWILIFYHVYYVTYTIWPLIIFSEWYTANNHLCMLLTWNIHVLIGSAYSNWIYKLVYSLDLAWTQSLNPISLFQINFLLQLDEFIFIGLFCLRDKL